MNLRALVGAIVRVRALLRAAITSASIASVLHLDHWPITDAGSGIAATVAV